MDHWRGVLRFCTLTLLFIGYLLERQRTVRNLKGQILQELERNIELRLQASAICCTPCRTLTIFGIA